MRILGSKRGEDCHPFIPELASFPPLLAQKHGTWQPYNDPDAFCTQDNRSSLKL